MISIATMTADGAEAMARLHALAFDSPWSGGEIRSLMEGLGASAHVALLGGEIVGFILCRVAADEAEVLTIAVQPEARRRGAAAALMSAAVARTVAAGARTLFLEVAEDNHAARGLYQRQGFVEVGRREAYYARPEGSAAALIMRLDLNR